MHPKTEKALEKLKTYIGKKVIDNDFIESKFLTYKIDGDKVIIITDTEPWPETNLFDLSEFLKRYSIIEDTTTEIVKTEQFSPVLHSSVMPRNIAEELRDTLLSNIRRVKEDPSYVPQAKVIGNNIQTLVNLTKLEIEIKTKL